MAKRDHSKTKEKQLKMVREGLGQGVGKDYKPWLIIQDVPSKGRRTRCMGIKIGREHHFLSDLERNYFYIVEYEDAVIDIREQFPLLPIEQTLAIADELGVEHPKDPKTQEPIVMTTDFVITLIRNNIHTDIARTIKHKDDLLSERTIEKFEIERRFWAMKEINWGIVTEEEVNKNVAQNISTVRPYYDLTDNEMFMNLAKKHKADLITQFKNSVLGESVIIRDKASEFDEKMGLEAGTSLSIFKHLLITKQIQMDLTKKLTFDRSVKIALLQDTRKGEYAV